jgi:hypothetical protein
MRVEKTADGRVLFLTVPGERFRWLKWCWHSFVIGFREGWKK